MTPEMQPCGYCGELTSNGCDAIAVVACDRHFGADTRAFAEMHGALAAERARAEAAEGREARLREALERIHTGACAVVSAAEVYGESEDTHLWREMLDTARAALAGQPEGEP